VVIRADVKAVPPQSRTRSQHNTNAKLANSLASLSHNKLTADGEAFAKSHNLGHLSLSELFRKGALVAQDALAFDSLPLLTDEDKEVLRHEIAHKWDQAKMLYYLVILCSVAAAHQILALLSYTVITEI